MIENSKNGKTWYKKPVIWGQGILLFFLLLFAIGFVAAMFSDTAVEWMGRRLGLGGVYEKNEVLSFLGIAMGGILIALQALAAYRRAKAMEDAASAQAAASIAHAQANRYIESGQRQERLKNAIEHLGHKSDSVRLGGAYELFHLAEDNKKLRQTILDILCAHIRRTTSEAEYEDHYSLYPSEEIQSLLTLLFVREHKVFSGCHINLQGSWLNGSNLQYARLTDADLNNVHLKGADLSLAKMQAANLTAAQMEKTMLGNTQMQAAFLMATQMKGAIFINTQMQAACFWYTNMQEAKFNNAQMQGARSEEIPKETFELTIEKFTYKEADLSSINFYDTQITNKIPDGIITGYYTYEEAEKWIDEYK